MIEEVVIIHDVEDELTVMEDILKRVGREDVVSRYYNNYIKYIPGVRFPVTKVPINMPDKYIKNKPTLSIMSAILLKKFILYNAKENCVYISELFRNKIISKSTYIYDNVYGIDEILTEFVPYVKTTVNGSMDEKLMINNEDYLSLCKICEDMYSKFHGDIITYSDRIIDVDISGRYIKLIVKDNILAYRYKEALEHIESYYDARDAEVEDNDGYRSSTCLQIHHHLNI